MTGKQLATAVAAIGAAEGVLDVFPKNRAVRVLAKSAAVVGIAFGTAMIAGLMTGKVSSDDL